MLRTRRPCLSDHPTPEDLAGFIWNRVPWDRARTIVSHLVRGCEPCRAAVVPHLASLFGRAEPPEVVLLPGEDAEYEAALDRAFATVNDHPKFPPLRSSKNPPLPGFVVSALSLRVARELPVGRAAVSLSFGWGAGGRRGGWVGPPPPGFPRRHLLSSSPPPPGWARYRARCGSVAPPCVSP